MDIKNCINIILTMLFLCLGIELTGQANWTIMYYAAGSNSSEEDLLSDVAEMKTGKSSDDYNLILLIDRTEGYSADSTTLDGNFNDTRLYDITPGQYTRLSGRAIIPEITTSSEVDLNMGDAVVLKRFIRYCKRYYPANNYMLIVRSHGNGQAMCPDGEQGDKDRIYVGEMAGVLDKEESVDILGLDVCSMAGLENLYEWRPDDDRFSVDYVIASAPLSGAWAYDAILSRLDGSKLAHNERTMLNKDILPKYLDPNTINAKDLSRLFMHEIFLNQGWASWGLFNNNYISTVKDNVDNAAQYLWLEDKAELIKLVKSTLGYHHNTYGDTIVSQLSFPYVDAYHFWNQIKELKSFSENSSIAAKNVCESIDSLVMLSYYGQNFLPETDDFYADRGGVYQIIPRGSEIYDETKRTFWSHSNWFHPYDQSSNQNSYGAYDWCKDSSSPGDQKVSNFYELLDYLYDESNDLLGGCNKYQW